MIAVRPMRDDDDYGYVTARWRNALFNTQGIHRRVWKNKEHRVDYAVPADHYHAEIQRVFSALMPRGIGSEIRKRADVRMACDSADDTTLAGFVCTSKLPDGGCELHFVYVADALRCGGVASKLLTGLDVRQFTFWTTSLEYLKPTVRGWRYTPRWSMH